MADFRSSIGEHPSRTDLATIEVPVVCTYGARSPGAGHAAPFDATANFVQLIADTSTSEPDPTPELQQEVKPAH